MAGFSGTESSRIPEARDFSHERRLHAADEHEELCAVATKAEIAYGREVEPERTEQEKIQAQEQE